VTPSVQKLTVHPCRSPLVGSVPVFDDQSILLARIALAAICRGRSKIELRQSPGPSAQALLEALELLGFESASRAVSTGQWEVEIVGRGLAGPLEEPGVLDVRGACDVGALLVGLLAGRVGHYQLLVDALVAEAAAAFLSPLGALRAEPVTDGSRGSHLHLTWPEGRRIAGFELESSGHFCWLKQAALLVGLRAEGETRVFETVTSADHLERALLRARAPIHRAGSLLTLHPPRDADALSPQNFGPIGSAQALAYLATAALVVPGSRIEVRGVSTNPSGPDVATLVRVLGGGATVRPGGDVQGEPFGDVTFFGRLGHGDSTRTIAIAGEGAVRLGDAIFPLLLAAAQGTGRFEFPELVAHGRGGDPRFIERTLGYLRSGGVDVELGGGISVTGRDGRTLSALRLTTGGDGRLAALGTLMALIGAEPSVLDDVDCLRAEFPRMIGTLKALGAALEASPA